MELLDRWRYPTETDQERTMRKGRDAIRWMRHRSERLRRKPERKWTRRVLVVAFVAASVVVAYLLATR